MQEETAKIIDRVQKMLALSESSEFAAEAATAMRMAERLLAKYNLTMRDVSKHASKDDDHGTIENVWRDYNANPWHRDIYNAVSQLYGCVYLYSRMGPNKAQHYIIGTSYNADVAYEMAKYVIKTAKRLAFNAWQNLDVRVESSNVYERSFCSGVSQSIYRRIQTILEGRREEKARREGATVSDSTALAVILEDAYNDAVEFVKENIKTKEVRIRRSSVDITAYEAGVQAGDTISLNDQIKGGGSSGNGGNGGNGSNGSNSQFIESST